MSEMIFHIEMFEYMQIGVELGTISRDTFGFNPKLTVGCAAA